MVPPTLEIICVPADYFLERDFGGSTPSILPDYWWEGLL
jgi:hypothetical protein